MKYYILLLLIILTISCEKSKKQHSVIGTWNICFRDGEYREYKITEKHILMLTLDHEKIWISSNRIEKNSLIWSDINPNYSSPLGVDTLMILSQIKNKLVLKHKFFGNEMELHRIKNSINEIDSSNLENWKSQTILGFRKRAELFKCPDLRTEEEKVLPNLGNSNLYEEDIEIDIPYDNVKDSLNKLRKRVTE